MSNRARKMATVATVSLLLGLATPAAPVQERPDADATPLPDLVEALKVTPGCLGVEVAPRTSSGKSVVFAWFADRQSLLSWYHGDVHQQVVERFFPRHEEGHEHGDDHTPLAGIPDDIGPLMVVASLTRAGQPRFQETTLPVSQLSIELYRPLPGGMHLGGRFAPESLRVKPLSAREGSS